VIDMAKGTTDPKDLCRMYFGYNVCFIGRSNRHLQVYGFTASSPLVQIPIPEYLQDSPLRNVGEAMRETVETRLRRMGR